MDWKAKRHIHEQMDKFSQRTSAHATDAELISACNVACCTPNAVPKIKSSRHRETVVRLVRNQIGTADHNFPHILVNAKRCNESKRYHKTCCYIVLGMMLIFALYVALIYGALVGVSACSNDEFGCAIAYGRQMRVPGLQFVRSTPPAMVIM